MDTNVNHNDFEQALQILSLYLVDKIQTNYRRRRLRKICSDEAPWRSQVSLPKE